MYKLFNICIEKRYFKFKVFQFCVEKLAIETQQNEIADYYFKNMHLEMIHDIKLGNVEISSN